MQTLHPRPASRLSRFLVSASARVNYEWALRRPGEPPFIVLTEFPRSGGNWIRDMLGDALQLPVPRFARLPITFRAIIHNHDHRPTGHPTVYVVRDPRDVFVSHFHQTVATLLNASPPVRRRILRLHPSLSPLSAPAGADAALMEQFYDEWLRRPLGSRVSWQLHVRAFLGQTRPNVTVIRYEDARRDAKAALSVAAASLTGAAPQADAIAFAVSRNEFHRQTGRPAGTADNTATKRRGIASGWREDLPSDLAERLAQDLAEEMAVAGYA